MAEGGDVPRPPSPSPDAVRKGIAALESTKPFEIKPGPFTQTGWRPYGEEKAKGTQPAGEAEDTSQEGVTEGSPNTEQKLQP